MAIKTDYNFKGIEVKDAIIRIERLWGSSKEGWSSLVTVSMENKEDYIKYCNLALGIMGFI